eukprot:TRINITY_DN14342_c0_g1_i1.p1 TRINITY_DN14342_c0_g1~~TRINITY_DN14342_c0_g1_i1.p1  ORF type:complete len:147 (-),score=9.43 TRINITY_DN14342_c0_g1_i1:88-498(-)
MELKESLTQEHVHERVMWKYSMYRCGHAPMPARGTMANCPPCAIGKIHAELQRRPYQCSDCFFAWCCGPCLLASVRKQIRTEYGIQDTCGSCATFCDCFCASLPHIGFFYNMTAARQAVAELNDRGRPVDTSGCFC